MMKILVTILAVPLIILWFLWVIIITPYDYVRYKCSRYYKDTKEKYSWLYTFSYYLRLYDAVKKADLPIDFYRFKEKGIPSIRTGQRGDQYVRIIVEVPKNLSSKQREILEEFAKESNEKNYNQRKKFSEKIKDYFK